jgi:preprotein translocase subunit SecG
MQTILLVIHLLLAITLVIVVLLQRSEGGGLGIGGGGSGGPAGMMSGRAAANILTRATAVLAAIFIGTSLVLAMMAGGTNTPRSVVDEAVPASELMPESAAQPPEPEEPAVPLSD